jgi:hypothetical protein
VATFSLVIILLPVFFVQGTVVFFEITLFYSKISLLSHLKIN